MIWHVPRNHGRAPPVPEMKPFPGRWGEVERTALSLSFVVVLGACKPTSGDVDPVAGGDPERGRAIIEASACAACHVIPGIAWPQGELGPDLHGFADQALISGRFPNRPDVLQQWVRNAPSLAPDTAMPAMPISNEEARDVAAYLYTLRAR